MLDRCYWLIGISLSIVGTPYCALWVRVFVPFYYAVLGLPKCRGMFERAGQGKIIILTWSSENSCPV